MSTSLIPTPNGRMKSLGMRILREHVRPYFRHFMGALLMMLLAALSTTALPFLLKPVFDQVFSNGTLSYLILVCGGIFLTFVVKGFASFGEAVAMTYIGQRIICDLQNRLFRHLMTADLSFFHQASSGDLLSRFTNDINLMRNAVSGTLVGIGKDFLTLVFLISLMFYRDWILATIAFVIFPTAIIPIINIGKRMRKVALSTQEELGNFTGRLTQIFQGIRVIKAYGGESYEIKRVESSLERLFQLIYKTARVRSTGHPIVETLGGVAIVVVIAYGGWQVMNHSRTTGDFISFIGALLLIYDPLKRLSYLNTHIQEGLSAASRVFELLDTPQHILDSPQAPSLPPFTQEIALQNVCFSYEGSDLVLDQISLIIPKGHTIAFVGASGAGKSTIINLIPRFYDVCDGQILIDGQDIKSITLASLRSQIALVSQEVALFDTTIRENITYGTWNATTEDIENAAQQAAAHDFICSLPDGYNTQIGENGVMLSGGQRQRLAIARAILKNAPILLLDEATSALDTESERQVQGALAKLMIGRTTIMVAHRLSTVVHATCIYVLEKGCIIASGTHQSLLQEGGKYAALWQAQSQVEMGNKAEAAA